jgi:predicted phosphoribosyltransferase
MRFRDRREAGRKLLELVRKWEVRPDLVLAIPRGGVVVGYEVATGLNAGLDIVMVRKIGVPGNPELAAGAVSEDGEVYVEQEVLDLYGLDESYVRKRAATMLGEVRERAKRLRGGAERIDVRDVNVLLVDDGMATGSTMIAGLRSVRRLGAKGVSVAAPVSSREALLRVSREADRAEAVLVPEEFFAVGEFYEHFPQVEDDEVVELLRSARRSRWA